MEQDVTASEAEQAAELLKLVHTLAARVFALIAERDHWMDRALAAEGEISLARFCRDGDMAAVGPMTRRKDPIH